MVIFPRLYTSFAVFLSQAPDAKSTSVTGLTVNLITNLHLVKLLISGNTFSPLTREWIKFKVLCKQIRII